MAANKLPLADHIDSARKRIAAGDVFAEFELETLLKEQAVMIAEAQARAAMTPAQRAAIDQARLAKLEAFAAACEDDDCEDDDCEDDDCEDDDCEDDES